MDDFLLKLKRMTGQCAANTDLDNVKSSIELAHKRIDQAYY